MLMQIAEAALKLQSTVRQDQRLAGSSGIGRTPFPAGEWTPSSEKEAYFLNLLQKSGKWIMYLPSNRAAYLLYRWEGKFIEVGELGINFTFSLTPLRGLW
jgi:hypothetical protein